MSVSFEIRISQLRSIDLFKSIAFRHNNISMSHLLGIIVACISQKHCMIVETIGACGFCNLLRLMMLLGNTALCIGHLPDSIEHQRKELFKKKIVQNNIICLSNDDLVQFI